MIYSKVKNGFKATIKDGSNKIIITNITTKKVVTTQVFKDSLLAMGNYIRL